VVESLSPDRYKVQFTASAELRDKIERLTALMRAEIPDGDLATVVERAVTEKLERLEAKRFARTSASRTTAPRGNSASASQSRPARHIPAAVRRAVHERDGSRCAFVDEQGRRCSERRRLEFHHRHPFAMGGTHDVANLSLLCTTHNRLMAEVDYGRCVNTTCRPGTAMRQSRGTTFELRARPPVPGPLQARSEGRLSKSQAPGRVPESRTGPAGVGRAES
jgi:hypothetical protein